MLDFIRKDWLWNALDAGLDKQIGKTGRFHLKSIQDLAVFSRLQGWRHRIIGEVGGGNSRILGALGKTNTCFNIEKFAGDHGGPGQELEIPGVTNVKVFLGEFSDLLAPNSFDCLCSVSVVEHVPTERLQDFLSDGLRVLKPGGLWLHAIDMYLRDDPVEVTTARYQEYVRWFDHPDLDPIGQIFSGPVAFRCDMASNPDDTMHSWGKVAPNLIPLRKKAQSVSILAIGTRR